MAFDRLTRFVAARREFKEDRDAHVTNLRLLETYLEQAKDWYPLLKKSALPVVSDVPSGSDAIVNVDGTLYHLVSGVWTELGGGSGVISSEFAKAGTLIVENGAMRWYADRDLSLIKAFASVGTAPAGSDITVRVNKNGASSFTLTIAAGGNVSTFDTPTLTLAEGDYITVDVTAIGSGTAGANLLTQLLFEEV